MMHYSTSPMEIGRSLAKNAGLVISLTKREIVGRYRGSAIGLMWSFFNPIFMLAVYTFVFSVVFKTRWGTGQTSKTDFALILFSGLIVFNLFAECINRAPTIITSNVNYVKKVVFPLEILPFVNAGTVLFHAAVSVAVWLIAYIIFYGVPHVTVLLFPLVILPLILLILGLSWALASLGVYLRDTVQFINIITTVLMFMSPIFYPVSLLPEKIRPILMLNPLAPTIEQARQVLFWGDFPSVPVWSLNILVSAICAWGGFAWFQKTRKGFADVL